MQETQVQSLGWEDLLEEEMATRSSTLAWELLWTEEPGGYSLSVCTVLRRSVVSDSATPWTVARQVPLSMGLLQEEYWSRLPCPPPGDLPNPGTEPRSPALWADSLPTEPPQEYCSG